MKRAGWVCTGLGLALGLLPVAAAPDLDRLVDGHTAFALELYSRLDREGNLFLSPYSLSSALAMTYAGARGPTASEMEQALVFRLGPEGTHPAFSALQARLRQVQEAGAVRLSVANSLWPQKGEPFRPDYLALLNEYYGTGITPLDFMGNPEEARQAINRWVEEQTQDKIRELIGRGVLGPLTRMVLVNAIYFKGRWAHAFSPGHTREADFFTGPGRNVTVDLM
ncbi:MAG: serpin family protein, partial [Lentisphaerae bacterium]|nr:serpin family protein [Lentisphaerota bacterium]